jgi:probable HAF family extracellular repeat protein
VTDLGVLPGKKESTPAAINTQGFVTGTSTAGNAGEGAFRYNPASKTGLEEIGKIPAQSLTRGFGINDAGQIVGDSTFGGKSIRRAALFARGTVADLGTLKAAEPYSRANAINGSGQVVGFAGPALDSALSRAFLWTSATGMVDIGTLGGAYAQALAINEAGFITGHSEVRAIQSGTGKGSGTHAFLYQSLAKTEQVTRPMLDLGTLGGIASYGTSINGKNHVVGYSTLSDSDSRIHAFLHDGTKMIDLGSLSGTVKAPDSDYSFALGINNLDQVVGYTYLPSGRSAGVRAPQQVAFIYRNGTMIDLNTLIGGAAKTMRLTSATAINDKGEIVASAIDLESNSFRAVLLTPAISRQGR